MVSACIKSLLVVQSLSAACIGNARHIKLRASAPRGRTGSAKEDLVFISHQVSKVVRHGQPPLPGEANCSPDQPVWWLHFPKCGTQFFEALRKCRNDPARPSREYHPALPANSHSVKNVVAIFRDPSQRLASAWTFMGSTHAKCDTWGCTGQQEDVIRSKVKENLTAASDEILGKSFLGCQTNMVLGKTCMEGSPADPARAASLAMDRVDKFLFVGLLEQWGLSVCLFNYKLTNLRYISRNSLRNERPTPGKESAEEHDTPFNQIKYDVQGYPRDVADEMLYEHVTQRFENELKLHGISRKTCSFDIDGEPLNIPRAFIAISEDPKIP